MFLIKKKTFFLDSFTYDQQTFDLYKPLPSKDALPLWWKKLKPYYIDNTFPGINYSTMKRCIGVIDLLTHGFLFMNNKDYCFAPNHKDEKLIKPINLDWIIRDKKNLPFTSVQPTWHYQDLNRMISLIPSIYNFRKPQEIEISLLITQKASGDNEKISIDKSFPIMQLIPLFEDEIELKYHLIDKKEYDSMLK